MINVATGSRVSINHLFRTVREMVSANLEPNYTEARQGDVRDSQADISKARLMLNYRPSVGLEEGLRRTIDWYRSTESLRS